MLHQVEKPIYSRRHQRPYRFAHRYFFVFIYDINFILIKTFFLYEIISERELKYDFIKISKHSTSI